MAEDQDLNTGCAACRRRIVELENAIQHFTKTSREDLKVVCNLILALCESLTKIVGVEVNKTIEETVQRPVMRRQTHSATMWITDGVVSKRHPKDMPIPPGFRQGRTNCFGRNKDGNSTSK